jgi:hypothetical protein
MKVYEDEHKIRYADDFQVRTVYKDGGVTTSIKHEPCTRGCYLCKDYVWPELKEEPPK